MLSVRGSVTCEPEAVRYLGRDVVLGCQDETTARTQDVRDTKPSSGSTLEEAGRLLVQVFPNPVAEQVTVTLESSVEETASVVVYDVTGKILAEQRVPVTVGSNAIELDTTSWRARGTLLLRITLPSQGVRQVSLIKE